MRRYGLLGRTLTHSFSQSYFTKKFAAEGVGDAVYENFELEAIADLPLLLKAKANLRGLNVTIPYKEEVVPFLTERSDVVKAIGACNCIKIANQKLVGYNTDVVGFCKSLEPQLKGHHQNALVLGTGGAAKAVCYGLKQLGINYRVISRTTHEGQWTYRDLDEEVIGTHHLIINTTPLGMYPVLDAAPPIPYHYLTPSHFLFDLIYNPAETKFLTEGIRQGAQVSNGHQMLIEQAEESWRIWSE